MSWRGNSTECHSFVSPFSLDFGFSIAGFLGSPKLYICLSGPVILPALLSPNSSPLPEFSAFVSLLRISKCSVGENTLKSISWSVWDSFDSKILIPQILLAFATHQGPQAKKKTNKKQKTILSGFSTSSGLKLVRCKLLYHNWKPKSDQLHEIMRVWIWNLKSSIFLLPFSLHHWVSPIQTYLGDIASLVPDYCNKVNITIKWVTWIFWFSGAYKSYVCTIL